MPPTDLPPRAVSGPQYQLYSIWAVLLATFLGSPLAGGVVMAVNCQRLSQPGVAQYILLISGVLTLGSLILGAVVPKDLRVMEALLVGLQVFVVYFFAARLQGRVIAHHQEQGGEMASYWSAAGIGIVCGIVLMLVLVALGLMPQPTIEGGAPLEPEVF